MFQIFVYMNSQTITAFKCKDFLKFSLLFSFGYMSSMIWKVEFPSVVLCHSLVLSNKVS